MFILDWYSFLSSTPGVWTGTEWLLALIAAIVIIVLIPILIWVVIILGGIVISIILSIALWFVVTILSELQAMHLWVIRKLRGR